MEQNNIEQNNKKKFFLYIVVGVVVVGLFVYFGVGKKFKTSEEERAWRAGEEQKVSTLIRAGDITKCDDVDYKASDGIVYKTVCINNIALEKAVAELDYVWCQKLDNKLFSIADCERQVMFGKLQKENSLEVCDATSSQELKNQCVVGYWNQKATSANDETFCKNLTDTQANASCKDNVYLNRLIKTPSSVACDIFSPGLKNDCEQFKAAKSGTVKDNFVFCRTILHPQLQFACER